ncbi:hypothetical protein C3F09_03885 [candidate division GN15 bacterium]|uniref:Metallo-beta-lactamase domain-containing protein n=1 Tax=candidate division GN15 bacterium TaxID=2072418 RepID=A0A855X8F8_9BACT|nr:MAG: hypothetical protein C3F09_03885 [candidate division GN15 bacterium]
MSASLTILGTAGGGPIPHRAKSGLLLRVDDRLSLIDCGGGIYQRFVDSGHDFNALDRVFISHTHPDHMSDLPVIVQAIYLTGRSTPFEIYVPEEFTEPCRNLLSSTYLFPDRFPCPLKIIGYGDRFTFRRDFELTAIANSHLAKFRTRETGTGMVRGECFSFAFSLAGKWVLYSSDIGSLDDLIPHWDGCECVILEAAHIDWSRFWVEAKVACVGEFIITHFLSEAQAFQIQQNARAHDISNLQTAHDGMTKSF